MFDLHHDYTETREGADRYLNVVCAGSRVSNPSARSPDSGESLPTGILRGDGRVRLDFWNRRPDEIDGIVRARGRAAR